MRNSLFILLITLVLGLSNSLKTQKKSIYQKSWIDFNKNELKDIFEDPEAEIDARVEDLLSQMTVDEKTAQCATLYGYKRVLKDELPTPEWKNEVWKDGIANIDEQLNGLKPTQYAYPYSKHAEAINTIQKWFIEETRLGIPVDFTNEGIHGLNHEKATLLPSPIAIGSTWNKNLVRQACEIVGKEGKALGYTNIYAPILDVARDPRWGRVVVCYGEDPYLVSELGIQMVKGGYYRPTGYFANEIWGNGNFDVDLRNHSRNIRREFNINNPSSAYFGQSTADLPQAWRDNLSQIDTMNYYFPLVTKITTLNDFIPEDVSDPETGALNNIRWLRNNWYLMRAAETYLLRAEAKFHNGDVDGATADINIVRARANALPATVGEVDLDYILDERMRELSWEENRRNTLARLGLVYERTKMANPIAGPTIQPFNNLFPIPFSEIERNTQGTLEQNPGYTN